MTYLSSIKMRASSADRWVTCKASAVLEAQNPWTRDTGTSPFAAEGTLAHEVAEYVLQDKLGLYLEPKPSKETTTGAMWHHASGYAEYVHNLTECEYSHVTHLTEVLVKIDGAPHVSGIADYIGIGDDGRVFVIDYKYGAGVPVPVEGNRQLMVYAVGAIRIADQLGVAVDSVTLAIYQPRVFGGVSDFTYSAEEILAFREELIDAEQIITHPDRHLDKVTFRQSDKGCRWCPIKDYCRTLIDPQRIKEIMEKITTIEDYEALSMEELEEVYELSKEAKDIFAQAEKALRSRMIKGESGRSFKVVKGVQRLDTEAYSQWLDQQVMLGTITEEQAFTRKPVTQTELKKIVDRDVAKEIASLPKSEGAPRIVGIDAKGQGLHEGRAAEVFSNIF